jgi:hypothetical protein
MRITEAGLRKIVREMLKEEIIPWDPTNTSTIESNPDDGPKEYVPSQADMAAAGDAYNYGIKQIAPTRPPPPPPAPAATLPPAATPKPNPNVAQIQRIIGAKPDGFWGAGTQKQFSSWIGRKAAEGISITGYDNTTQIDPAAFANWKNVAAQIQLVGQQQTPKGFQPNLTGLLQFINIVNSQSVKNRAAVASQSSGAEALKQPAATPANTRGVGAVKSFMAPGLRY